MDIITLIKFIGGIFFAVHEMDQMMDSMVPAQQGVVLVPINAR